MTTTHTICGNCDFIYDFIPMNERETTRCWSGCGVYMDDAYDEECSYLDGGGEHFCEFCYENEESEKKNINECKRTMNKDNMIRGA